MLALFEGKERPMKRTYLTLFGSTVVLILCLLGFEDRAEALPIVSLDFTSGAVNWDGRHGQILDRLFAQDGSITVGSYQSTTDIVDPITHGHNAFSLFTSGLNGSPTPSASINGASITLDLSSLYFGVSRGDHLQAWNIGGMATGVFNPQTSEFSLTWEHLFHERGRQWKHDKMGDHSATFFLQGTAVVAQAPVPLSTSLIFFVTGLLLLSGFLWRRFTTLTPAGTVS
jgi:hypothetical protein